jgi:hypothetical protein
LPEPEAACTESGVEALASINPNPCMARAFSFQV